MSTLSTRRPVRRRPAVIAFGAGFLGAFIFAFAALASTAFEPLKGLLVPAVLLLAPVSERFADWNGFLTLSLTGVLNGAVYAVLAMAAVAGLGPLRHR